MLILSIQHHTKLNSKSIKMKNLFIFLLCIISASGIFAQTELSGKVADESESPLIGVTVFIKGTTIGTITDAEGNYMINSKTGEGTLVFSFIGMKTQEINFEGNATINVVMVYEAIGLEEVVAIGYGTVRKRALTGAVSSVKSEEITMAPVANTIEAI